VPASKAAGLQGLRIHDLRHTAVALWIAAGATPKEVAVRAGHTSVSFTLDRYGHLYPEADTTLRDRLEALHTAVRPADGVVIQFPQPGTGTRGERGQAFSCPAVGMGRQHSGSPSTSFPWNHREPLCEPPFPQVTPDRRGQSYRFSSSEVMGSVPATEHGSLSSCD
jgi:hypothetical protein